MQKSIMVKIKRNNKKTINNKDNRENQKIFVYVKYPRLFYVQDENSCTYNTNYLDRTITYHQNELSQSSISPWLNFGLFLIIIIITYTCELVLPLSINENNSCFYSMWLHIQPLFWSVGSTALTIHVWEELKRCSI